MPFVANYTKLGEFVLLKRFILKIDILVMTFGQGQALLSFNLQN